MTVPDPQPTSVSYRTTPMVAPVETTQAPARTWTVWPLLGWWRTQPVRLLTLAALLGVLLFIGNAEGSETTPLTSNGRLTLAMFAVAVWAWAFTRLDDTFVALCASTGLVILGVIDTEALFATLGDDTVWLLVGAFIIAGGITSSGLAARCAAWVVTGARNARQLVHLTTAALVVTTYAVPATSGRAALALPVFLAMAGPLLQQLAPTSPTEDSHGDTSRRLVKALAVLFPTVILLSAVGSFVGAGAHLVSSRVLEAATGQGFSFAQWLILGLPLAVVNSHLAAELVLRLFTRPEDRHQPLSLTSEEMQHHVSTPLTGPLTVAEGRAGLLLAAVVTLWCTESLHGLHPAIVAMAGALITTSPRYGSVTLKKTLAKVPWSLLLFMAATLALGDALISTRAAEWVAHTVFGGLNITSAVPFMAATVVLSTMAHLLIQSRSARSAVLIPIIVGMAPLMGVSPHAAAFASTAAAGFCHTLPSSAKPVTLFSDVPDVPTYTPADLRRLSVWLGPLTAVLILLFSVTVWPVLGLPL